MPQETLYDDDDTAELYENTAELPATSPELPIDARAIVAWRKEASKSFKCGIPQTVNAVDPYATAEQRTAPAPVHKRTLDDMRRMSEQIKRTRVASALEPSMASSPRSKNGERVVGFLLGLHAALKAFLRRIGRAPNA